MKRLVSSIVAIGAVIALGIIIAVAFGNAAPEKKLMKKHPYVFSQSKEVLKTRQDTYTKKDGCVYLAWPETKNKTTDGLIDAFIQEGKSAYEKAAEAEAGKAKKQRRIPRLVVDYTAVKEEGYTAIELFYELGRYQPDGTGEAITRKEAHFYLDEAGAEMGLNALLGEETEEKLELMLRSSGKKLEDLKDFKLADGQLELIWAESTETFGVEEIRRAGLIDPNKPMIALTFDDGPGKLSKKFADLFARYGGHATFFVVGTNVLNFPEELKYLYEMGNEIGSHTMRHKNLNKLSAEGVRKEVEDADNAIQEVIGKKPDLMRAPYGNANSTVMNVMARPQINWSVDTEDWRSRNAQSVKNEILKGAGDGEIVLMHEIYQSTYDGLEMAIEELAKQGYQFVTVSELMRYRNVTPEVKIYHSFLK